MKFVIEEKLARNYPELRIAVLVAKDVRIQQEDRRLESLKRKVENEVRSRFRGKNLVEHPFIAAWRDAYRSFGAKPKKYNPTAEALIRRILRGNAIPRINTLVDCYLVIEAKYLLPIGGYDLNKVKENIYLRYSKGNEEFIPLGKGEVERTNVGEVVYADEEEVLTRKWNYRDCEQTKITLETKKVALFMEAVDKRIPTDALENAVKELEELILDFCGGRIRTFLVIPSEKLEWEIM